MGVRRVYLGKTKVQEDCTNPTSVSGVVTQRLGYAAGSDGDFIMAKHMSGPIAFADAPKPVQELFSNESLKVTRVIVVHRDLNTDKDPADGFVWVWDRLPD